MEIKIHRNILALGKILGIREKLQEWKINKT